MMLLQTQKELLMAGMGPGSEKSIVTMENLFNTLKAMVENMGYKATGDFITDPNDPKAQRDPPKQPQPSKEQLDHQLNQQKLQQEGQLAQAKLQQDGQLKSAELQQNAAQAQLDYEIAKEQNALKSLELELKREELSIKAWGTGHSAALNQSADAREEQQTDTVLENENMVIDLLKAQAELIRGQSKNSEEQMQKAMEQMQKTEAAANAVSKRKKSSKRVVLTSGGETFEGTVSSED